MDRLNRLFRVSHEVACGLALLVILTACGSASREAETSKPSGAPVPAPTGAIRLTLERFPTPRGSFELSIAPCAADGCAFDVTWFKDGNPPSSIRLPIKSATQVTSKEPVDVNWGADPGKEAWASGVESDYVATAARPLALDDTTVGLLVTQRYGFDHLKRSHRLLVPRGGRLAVAWEYDEAPGATWSGTIGIPRSANAPGQVALLSGRLSAVPSEADQMAANRLVWNPAAAELRSAVATRGDEPVASGLLVGNFATAAEARNDPAAALDCTRSLWVLSSTSIPGLDRDRVVLGRLYARRQHAEQERQRLVKCDVSLEPSIVDIPGSPRH